MIEGKCPLCDYFVDDGEHVDDAVQKLNIHYRATHPNRAFYEQSHKENIERFNLELGDIFVNYFGPNWEGLERLNLEQAANRVVRNGHLYREATIEEARQFLNARPPQADDNANAQANNIANAEVPVDPRGNVRQPLLGEVREEAAAEDDAPFDEPLPDPPYFRRMNIPW